MTVTVVCNNVKCEQYDNKKTVGRQHLGQGIYLGGPMLCECGYTVTEL